MPSERASAKAIFDEAAEIVSAELRAAYLDQACGGDAGLRGRVEALLRAHAVAGSFLESVADLGAAARAEFDPAGGTTCVANPTEPAGAAASAAVAPGGTSTFEASGPSLASAPARPFVEGPGSVIGPYKLLEKIGEGGMGAVYLAEQTRPVRRRVALKVIKPGMDTDQVVARFEAERQALAMMDHAGIAKVLDAGATDSGRPFFVMELVSGVPITEYCDAAQLTTRERLELFIPICQAVQHAHQKGIIHRDIKPSNILVAMQDGKPVTKVIDFGIAKAIDQQLTEKTFFTQHGAIVGTLEYMSPEQAELSTMDLDTRTDVYALGVLLYELLTGSTPLERARLRAAGYSEILRRIREEEPPKPSTRLSESRDALPSVAALRKTEPAKLTKLIRGDLDWIVMKSLEKDRTRRYETASGFAREIERYLAGDPVEAGPPGASYRLSKYARKHRVALMTAGAFVAFFLVAFGLSTWLAVAASRARDQARTALADARKAKLATEEALAESENARKEAQAVNGFLINSFGRPDPEQDGAKLLVVDVLDHALADLDDVYPGTPVIKGTLLSSLGRTYFGLGQFAKAVDVRTRAREVFEAALGPDSPDTLRSRALLGLAYREAGRPAEAITLLQATLKRQEETLSAGNDDIIDTRIELASTYLDVGRPIEAVTLLDSTLKLCDAKKDSNDGRTNKVSLYLGRAHQDAGNSALAIKIFESALDELQRSPGPKRSNIPAVRNDLALAYAAAGKTTEVISMHQETLKLIEAAVGRDHPDAIVSRHNLGLAYADAGRMTEAVELLEETLKLFKSKLGADHPRTLKARDRLATTYRAQGKFAEAASFAEETLRLSEAKLGQDHPVTLSSRNTLANAYLDIGKPAEALELNKTTLRIRESKFGRDHPETITSRHNLAWAYRHAGKTAEALALFEMNLKLSETKHGPDHPSTLHSREGLASISLEVGKVEQAIELNKAVLKVRESRLGLDHPNTMVGRNNLAMAYRDARMFPEAIELLEANLKLREAKLGLDHPDTLQSRNNLASAYWSIGRLDRSIPLFESTLAIHEPKLGPDHPQILFVRANLGVNYRDANRLADGIRLMEDTLRRIQHRPPGQFDLPSLKPSLATAYDAAGQFAKSEPLYREALAAFRKNAGPAGPELAIHLVMLASNLLGQSKWNEAEPLLRECLAIREKNQPDEWSTFNSRSMLGACLLGESKFAEAEPLILSGYEGLKARETRIPAPVAKLRLAEAEGRVIRLYKVWGKTEKAAEWRRRLGQKEPAEPELPNDVFASP